MFKNYLALLLALTMACPAWAIERNVASQKITVTAIDRSTGGPKTGDAGNITVYVSKDDGTLTALGDTSATEISSTNAPGSYLFDLTQSETSAGKLLFSGKSSTSNVDIVPQTLYTTPEGFSTLSIANNAVASNVERWQGSAFLPPFIGKVIYVATTGNDSNAGTKSAPKLTVNGAIAIATAGDVISVGSGTFSGQISNSVQNLTIVGAGRAATILTHNSGVTLTNSANHFTLRKCRVSTTSTTLDANQRAIQDTGVIGSWYDEVDVRGWSDAIFFAGSYGARITNSFIDSKWDVITAGNGLLIEGCQISGDGSYDTEEPVYGLRGGGAVTIRNTVFNMARNNSANGVIVAVCAKVVDMQNCILNVSQNEEAAGQARGFEIATTQSVWEIKSTLFNITHTGGTTYDIYQSDGAGSSVTVTNCKADPAKIYGDVQIVNADVAATKASAASADTKANLLTDGTNGLAAIKTAAGTAATQATAAASTSSTINAKIGTPAETLAEDIQGIEAGGGTPTQVHNTDPVAAFTAKLGSRADSVVKAYPVLKLTPHEAAHIWIDCSKLTNVNLASVTNAVSSDTDVAEVTDQGMIGKYISVVLDTSGASPGDTATISGDCSPVGPWSVDVEIKAP